MEILEAFDATGCAHSAAALAGGPEDCAPVCGQAGRPVSRSMGRVARPKLIDAYVDKIEELVRDLAGRCASR